ncbi:hypothetical protein AB685_15875 [Bacillus sp. LL01]|nr:hypothetical protein AB685_15875 [Bacillus sp. LL01]
MASLAIPGLFTYTEKQVKVEYKEGYSEGLSIADFRPGVPKCTGPGCVRIATDIDESIFFVDMLRNLIRND